VSGTNVVSPCLIPVPPSNGVPRVSPALRFPALVTSPSSSDLPPYGIRTRVSAALRGQERSANPRPCFLCAAARSTNALRRQHDTISLECRLDRQCKHPAVVGIFSGSALQGLLHSPPRPGSCRQAAVLCDVHIRTSRACVAWFPLATSSSLPAMSFPPPKKPQLPISMAFASTDAPPSIKR